MLSITVRHTDRLRQLRQNLPVRLERTVRATLADAVAYGRKTGFGTHTTPTRLAVRSGALRASFQSQVKRQGTTLTGRLGFIGRIATTRTDPLIYAPVHEFGATIRPRFARFLAIPLRAARGKRPRDFIHTFVNKGIIYQRMGKRIVPLFVLRRSVTIPARPVLAPTWRRTHPLLLARLQRVLQP